MRWTGTLPYAAVETYAQMIAGMRAVRAARDILAHLDGASTFVQLDQSGTLADATNPDAQALVRRPITRATALLRDLAQTAWVRSGDRLTVTPADNPILQTHPQ